MKLNQAENSVNLMKFLPEKMLQKMSVVGVQQIEANNYVLVCQTEQVHSY